MAKPDPKYIKQLGKLAAPFADLSNGADHALAIDAEGTTKASESHLPLLPSSLQHRMEGNRAIVRIVSAVSF
jgi:hypothetical protein